MDALTRLYLRNRDSLYLRRRPREDCAGTELMAVRSRVATVSAVFRSSRLMARKVVSRFARIIGEQTEKLSGAACGRLSTLLLRRSSVAPFALIIPAMNKDEILSLLDAEVARLKLLRAFVACYALPQSVDLSLRRMSQRMEISATTHAEIRPASKSRCRVRLR